MAQRHLQIRRTVSDLFRDFNEWRKSRWLFRACLLVLVCSPALIPRLFHKAIIVGLVENAIQAVYNGTESPLVIRTAEFHNAREAKRLQVLLLSWFGREQSSDVSGRSDQLLRSAGIAPSDLRCPAKDANLARLVAASRQLGLGPSQLTAREIRRQSLRLAIAETEEMLGPLKDEVNQTIESYYDWPDYRKPEVWHNGWRLFLFQLRSVLELGSPPNMVFLLLLWSLAGGIAAGWHSENPGLRGSLTAAVIMLAMVAVVYKHPEYPVLLFRISYWLRFMGILCYSAVVGSVAARIWSRAVNPRLLPVVPNVGLGVMLVVVALSRAPAFRLGISPWGGGFPAMRLSVLGASGALLLAVEAALLYRGHVGPAQREKCEHDAAQDGKSAAAPSPPVS